jgi:hypothetical protein
MKFDYSDISEKVYSRSFFAVCIFVVLCLIIAYKNDDNIVELMRIVLDFAKWAIIVYVAPIVGDKIKPFTTLFDKTTKK